MGVPLDRRITKSSRLAFSNETSPRTTSSKAVVPVSGTRKRTTRPLAGAEAPLAAVPVVAGRAATGLGAGLDRLGGAVAPVGRAPRPGAASTADR